MHEICALLGSLVAAGCRLGPPSLPPATCRHRLGPPSFPLASPPPGPTSQRTLVEGTICILYFFLYWMGLEVRKRQGWAKVDLQFKYVKQFIVLFFCTKMFLLLGLSDALS